MKHVFCSPFASYSLTMESSVARIGRQHHNFNSIYAMRSRGSHRMYFSFWKHLSSMKSLCVLRRIIWKFPLAMVSVSRLAWEPSLHVNSPREIKPLSLCKIALCIHGECWLTTDSNNAPRIQIEVNSRLPLLCSFPFFVKKCYCKLNGS